MEMKLARTSPLDSHPIFRLFILAFTLEITVIFIHAKFAFRVLKHFEAHAVLQTVSYAAL